MDVDAVEQVLRAHGCTITPQRRAVLRFLDGNLDHPSAARIYEAVTADLPVSSRATVYNTLALLVQLGVVGLVRGTDGEMRYDPNTDAHHHLFCDQCGRLEDVPASAVTLLLRGQPTAGEVRFSGRCPGCPP